MARLPREIQVRFGKGFGSNKRGLYSAELDDDGVYVVNAHLGGRSLTKPANQPEELIATFRPATRRSSNGPSWSTYGLIPLAESNVEYRNPLRSYNSAVDFFGGDRNPITLEVDIQGKSPLILKGVEPEKEQQRLRTGVQPFFDAYKNLKPGDKVHFEKKAKDVYRVWVETKQSAANEELVLTLSPAIKGSVPCWKEESLLVLSRRNSEYRNASRPYRSPPDFFGGVNHQVEVQTQTRGGRVVKMPVRVDNGNRFRGGFKPFFRVYKMLRPGDEIHFEKTGKDAYNVWAERSGSRLNP